MESVVKWLVLCNVFVIIIRVIKSEYVDFKRPVAVPAPEFARHTIVKPRFYHGREKREIASSKEEEEYIHDITVGFNVDGKDFVLDLQLNRDLIPKTYFEKYQHNGQHVVNRPTGKDAQLCHYQGKLRGVENSWAAISTCNGLSGVVFDGEEMHYLERVPEVEDEDLHYVYKHSDLKANYTCGFSGTPHHIFENQEFHRILRYKRSTQVIRGPYNANKQSRYVELVLVVDNKEYKEMGEDLPKVHNRCKEIANIINALYVPLNIFIALVGVVVWTEVDEISLSPNGDTTLTNFLHYRRERLVKEHPNDNAQLLTRIQFEGGVVGKALKGPICTYEFSGGVSMDHSNVIGLVATTVAHELGHNFGMEHDTGECDCPKDRCIMAPSSSPASPSHWSSCSLEYLALAFEHGMDYCLRNKPERLFDSPVCGNGFVEAGEQCDCGLKDHCDNPCCNATSCMLYANASCATGECCDLKTCRPHTAGTICRLAEHQCDLPEFCTGQSEFCPDDVFKMDGEPCNRGSAFCYHGSCRTHSDQCKLLWGPSGKNSDYQCYEKNTNGNRYGNCGYNRVNESYFKCDDENVFCGMLHCKHLNERLEFGMESVAILSHSFINAQGSIIPCRSAIVDLGLNEKDPGLAPDGARCGDGKMCVNQKCMAVGSLQMSSCLHNCNGNGVCNSKGHCHCDVGFAPPFCDYPGAGGSEDSGPASDPNARREVVTAMYIIFLGIVPFVVIIALLTYYTRRNVKHWWKKAPDGITQSMAEKTPPHRSRPPSFSKGDRNNVRGLEISNPLPSDNLSSDGAAVTLLPKSSSEERNGGLNSGFASPSSDENSFTPATANNPQSFQTNFFGQFKGFSITPLPTKADPHAPSAPPLATAPAVPPPPVTTASNTISYAVSASVTPAITPAIISSAPTRPVISSPVLNSTSSTAKELISHALGTTGSSSATSKVTTNSTTGVNNSYILRKAPDAPVNGYSNPPKTANSKPRPISSPNALAITHAENGFPAPSSTEPSHDEALDQKGKEGGSGYTALTKLASILRPTASRSQSQNQGPKLEKGKQGSHSLPRNHSIKGMKIDRDSLRNLEISSPIPQQEIDIPQKAVPVRPAPSPPGESPADNNTNASVSKDSETSKPVMRAQSMRDDSVTKRPQIPNFGSMRAKRPVSIPTARPTSPPPRPPPPKQGNDFQNGDLENCYDDCLNLIEGTAPLANIDEETSPTSGDNIYAVIEENPVRRNESGYAAPVTSSEFSKSSSPPKLGYTSPTFNEYQSPKPLENSVSAGSTESVGLLSEIVSEIQARNIESIYTSTLGRKKKKAAGDADNDSQTTSTETSGSYTTPPSILSPTTSAGGLLDKTRSVASSNSSLGTYVNAPYTSSIYRPGSSTYSNLSGKSGISSIGSNSLASSGLLSLTSKPSSTSASAYLTPNPVLTTTPKTSTFTTNSTLSSTVPKTNAPLTSTTTNSGAFSTFKGPLKTISATPLKTTPSITTASSLITSPQESKVDTKPTVTSSFAGYKPYSSSLTRSSGPLSSFRNSSFSGNSSTVTGSSDSADKANTTTTSASINSIHSKSKVAPLTAAKPNLSKAIPASVPSVSSLTSSVGSTLSTTTTPSLTAASKPETKVADSSLSKAPITSISTPKPVLSTYTPAAKPTSGLAKATLTNNQVQKPVTGTKPNPVSNSSDTILTKAPDIVTSCGTKAPGVPSNPSAPKTKPDLVSEPGKKLPSGTLSAQPLTKTATRSSLGKSGLGSDSVVTKGLLGGSAGVTRAASVPKQPQTAPKPGSKAVNSVTSSSAADRKRSPSVGRQTDKTSTDSSGKPTVAKSASSITKTPGSRPAVASKVSHVASLQQKFETAAANSNKTSGKTDIPRVPSNSKTRPPVSSKPDSSAKSAGVKK